MLELYLVRHGQTEFSRQNRFCGAIDPPLNAVGSDMAACLGEAYGGLGWDAIYTSPRQRTIATAAPLAAKAGITPVVHEGLAEIAYGEWEGSSHEEIRAQHPEAYAYWAADPASRGTPGGETAFHVAARATRVIAGIIDGANDRGRVLVVSHKATLRIIACALLGLDVRVFRKHLAQPVGALTRFDIHAGRPVLALHGDDSYLPARLRGLEGT